MTLPALPGISNTPTDPGCSGTKHGSQRAYRENGCRCPEVVEHMRLYEVRRKAREVERRAAVAAGLLRRETDLDEGDVEAAVWAARRCLPMPAGLTRAELRAVALRLRRMGDGWSGLISVEEIARRIGIAERTVDRYLERERRVTGRGAGTELVAA